MTQTRVWIRRLPLALLAMLGGTALMLCNPGYYWDDWVWLFQDRAQTIRIGQELGIWWGGYATSLINALPHPALTMRAVALVTWIVSIAAAAYVLRRKRLLSDDQAFVFFVLGCSTHVSLIRFLTSVAFYNVYIASFWIAVALFVSQSERKRAIAFSVPFFFFSFYLNSLIVMFALALLCFALEDRALRSERGAAFERLRNGARSRNYAARTRSALGQLSLPRATSFVRANVVLIALPVVFLISKRLTTISSPLYNSYNAIDHAAVFIAAFRAFTLMGRTLSDFFWVPLHQVPAPVLAIPIVVCFLLIKLLPRLEEPRPLRSLVSLALFALVLFAAATYPYIVVEKVPDLTSFYESRHIMPAVVALDLMIVALIGAFDGFVRRWKFLGRHGRDVVLACVIGMSLGASFNTGTMLWRDWFRQTAIMDFVRAHSDALKDVRTFVINDLSTGTRIGERVIWNYEYTGDLITVYGTRDRLGVGSGEYANWPLNVPLLRNEYLRKRFNIRDYDFTKPHAIITIRDSFEKTKTLQVLAVVKQYLLGENWHPGADGFTRMSLAYEQTVADQRAKEMFDIAHALMRYREDHGAYPSVVPPTSPGNVPWSRVVASGDVAPQPILNDIPGLFPQYMQRPASMNGQNPFDPSYLYISDGDNYKLVFMNPPDLPYAKQAHAALIDPVRPAYGIWTLDARGW